MTWASRRRRSVSSPCPAPISSTSLAEVRMDQAVDPVCVVVRFLERGRGRRRARRRSRRTPPARCCGRARGRALAQAPPRRRVPHDAVDRADAVLPPDLLALGVRAARVRDADLVDPPARGRDLRGDLGLEPEAVLLDLDRLDHLTPERLVTGLHVGEVQVGEHVRRGGEQPVADRVPVVEDAVRATGEEPRPVDHVGVAGEQRLRGRARTPRGRTRGPRPGRSRTARSLRRSPGAAPRPSPG